jgi:hypothetical protein
MLWFENARRLDSAISPKAVLRNLPKLRHNRAEFMRRREGVHRTDKVSGDLGTDAATAIRLAIILHRWPPSLESFPRYEPSGSV